MTAVNPAFPRYQLEPTTFDGPLVEEGAEAEVRLIVKVVEVPPAAARERGRPVLLRVMDFAGPSVDVMFVAEPLTPRARRAPSEMQALLAVEKAARELDALFGGKPDEWRLGGQLVTNVDVSTALLSLHDYLNDVANARHPLAAPVTGSRP